MVPFLLLALDIGLLVVKKKYYVVFLSNVKVSLRGFGCGWNPKTPVIAIEVAVRGHGALLGYRDFTSELSLN